MKTPRITCVIPCYNQAEFLSEAIESVLDQSVKAEIVVVDDGSTDYTIGVAKSYPVIFVIKDNKGLAEARNSGIDSSFTEYVLPLDADDMLLPGCIEKIEKSIKESGSDVIAPSFKTFGVSTEHIILGGVPTLDMMKTGNRLPYFSAFKKSVWKEVGGYNPNMTWGWEDYNFWLDVFKRGHSLCVINEPLVLYRTKERSMIHVANEHSDELWATMKSNHPEIWPQN